jgi:AcrR family transcriptional regulator
MTEKQEKIVQAALELFAQEGYHATSTSKLARVAGVSEGLIFRHFGNKEGLLEAVIKIGEQRLRDLYADIVLTTDPKEVIRKTVKMPFLVEESDYEFWNLQFKLKWELPGYDPGKMEPLQVALTHAFRKLGHESPELEAEFLIHALDGIGSALLKGGISNKEALKEFMLNKYRV